MEVSEKGVAIEFDELIETGETVDINTLPYIGAWRLPFAFPLPWASLASN